jgi:hypothetical protein
MIDTMPHVDAQENGWKWLRTIIVFALNERNFGHGGAQETMDMTNWLGARLRAVNEGSNIMATSVNAKNAKSDTDNGRTQTFSFPAPTARRVQLVGDFTQWQQAPIKMQKGADGIWRTTVVLEPGQHYYRFLVDGQWHDDPECPWREPNPFGTQNAVRIVI